MQDFKITIMFKTGSVKSHNHIGKSGFYSLMFSMGYFFSQYIKNLHKDNIYHCESGNVDYLNTVLNSLIKWSLRVFWGKTGLKCRFRFCQVCYKGQFNVCLPRGSGTFGSSSSPPSCPKAALAVSASFQKLLHLSVPVLARSTFGVCQ